MRRVVLAALAVLLLFPLPSGGARPKVIVAPVLAEGEGGGLPSEPWRDAVSARLSDRFEVVALPHPPQDLETALTLARAARVDYLVEVRYTRLGASSTLDLTLRLPSGRIVDTVTSDAAGASSKGDQARLTIAAVSRLAGDVVGTRTGTASSGPAGTEPPAGILERGPLHAGRIDASAPAFPAGKEGEGGWYVASGGVVRYFPTKEADGAPPEEVATGAVAAGVNRIAALPPSADGRADVAVGWLRDGRNGTTVLRRERGSWKVAPVEGPAGVLLRGTAAQGAPTLFAASPGEGGIAVSADRPPDGKGSRAPSRRVAFPGRTIPGGREEVPLLLPGGGIGWARVDGQGRLVLALGGAGGDEVRSEAPAGSGRVLLLPSDIDGDGGEELLVVSVRERPGALFGGLAVASGSEVACFVLRADGPPRLAWRLQLPVTGIADGWGDRGGVLHFLAQETDPAGGSPAWRTLRVR